MLADHGDIPLDMPVSGATERVWSAMSVTPAPSVVVFCAPPSSSTAEASDLACAALEQALRTEWGAAPQRQDGPLQAVPGQIAVMLDLVRVEKTFLLGRLMWHRADGAVEQGPLHEISVMDAGVTPATYERLARAVLKSSDIPI